MNVDVAVMGGGPVGSTLGTLLKKYHPALSVAIFEKAKFPRDHVGESLLPVVTGILAEMGVWDKVEAAGFPIKLGAVYRWGRSESNELYYFHFLSQGQAFTETQRPGRYVGQRANTAFQVDRAMYDDILLDHARSMGCQVFEQARVSAVNHTGDHIDSLTVEGVGESGAQATVVARHYVDCTGSESVLRKALNVGTQVPTLLRNIAIWDYWRNAEWAERIGKDGTFVYVMSLGYGWLWFIPLGPDRTSLGLVTSVDYYKRCGLSYEELYLKAISEEPLIRDLTRNAERENKIQATKDWNFVADRLYGDNWFLAGDAGGFADPILAAGMTLAQSAGRRVALSIIELERKRHDPQWIKEQYNRIQRKNTLNHIRFAEYWYSANAHFSDLKEYCAEIARDSGFSLDPDAAFQWLGTGGFSEESEGIALSGAFTLRSVKGFVGQFGGHSPAWAVQSKNIFRMNLEGAERESRALYAGGEIKEMNSFRRGDSTWPLIGYYGLVYAGLKAESKIEPLAARFMEEAMRHGIEPSRDVALNCLEVLEALVADGWVTVEYDPAVPLLEVGLDTGVQGR